MQWVSVVSVGYQYKPQIAASTRMASTYYKHVWYSSINLSLKYSRGTSMSLSFACSINNSHPKLYLPYNFLISSSYLSIGSSPPKMILWRPGLVPGYSSMTVFLWWISSKGDRTNILPSPWRLNTAFIPPSHTRVQKVCSLSELGPNLAHVSAPLSLYK